MLGIGIEAIVAARGNQAEDPSVAAGLVDADDICVSAILVKVNDDGDVIDYAPPDGLRLILSDTAAVGRVWNGTAFVDP